MLHAAHVLRRARLLAIPLVLAIPVRCERPAAASADPPTFARDVAPILFENCAVCHRPEGPAPFNLLTYDDARQRGALIAAVTRRRFMPPWLPRRPQGVFLNERRLGDAQIEILERWVEAGMPEGDPAQLPPAPRRAGGWHLGEPDLVVEMSRPYTLAAGRQGSDVFRNFVLPVPIDSLHYVRAVEIRPGSAKVVHHAVLSVDRTAEARRLDELDPEPGYDGMAHGAEIESPDGFFLGWTPGKFPQPDREGVSWRVEPGTDLVLQLHLRPGDEATEIRSAIGLYFADRPPERIPALIRLADETIDIPAGEDDYVIEDRYVLPVDVEALGIYPHAHYLGDRMQAWAELPDGSTRWLIEIESWDFNWQDEYRYAEPVSLPRGTTLRMRYSYDNSASNPRNPHSPPRRVVYGPQSDDEMGDLMIQVLPRSRADLETLKRDFAVKNLRTKVAGYRQRLEQDPGDVHQRHELAISLAALGELDAAIEQYREVLRHHPADSKVHYNLGVALQSRGRIDEAIEQYRRALALDPAHARAHFNLAGALLERRRGEEAIDHYRRAVEADPELFVAHVKLGELLAARGSLDEAIAHHQRAVELRPEDPRAHYTLGVALATRGHGREALEALAEASRLEPQWTAPLVARAEILATYPDPSVRDPDEGIRAARRAVEATGARDPIPLSVLAAALAAGGRYDEAVRAAEQARSIALAAGAHELAASLARRAERYRQGRP